MLAKVLNSILDVERSPGSGRLQFGPSLISNQDELVMGFTFMLEARSSVEDSWSTCMSHTVAGAQIEACRNVTEGKTKLFHPRIPLSS